MVHSSAHLNVQFPAADLVNGSHTTVAFDSSGYLQNAMTSPEARPSA